MLSRSYSPAFNRGESLEESGLSSGSGVPILYAARQNRAR